MGHRSHLLLCPVASRDGGTGTRVLGGQCREEQQLKGFSSALLPEPGHMWRLLHPNRGFWWAGLLHPWPWEEARRKASICL